jgi:hypothetical protein
LLNAADVMNKRAVIVLCLLSGFPVTGCEAGMDDPNMEAPAIGQATSALQGTTLTRGIFTTSQTMPLNEAGWLTTAISFPKQTASPPIVEIHDGGLGGSNCPGTAQSPDAARGYLCIYISVFGGVQDWYAQDFNGGPGAVVSRLGTTLVAPIIPASDCSYGQCFAVIAGAWALRE